MKSSTKVIIVILVGLLLVFGVSSLLDDMSQDLEIAYDGLGTESEPSLRALLEQGKVDSLYVSGYKVYILRNIIIWFMIVMDIFI